MAFKVTKGYWEIESEGVVYYMRSHPRLMLASMKRNKHDKMVAFTEPNEAIATVKEIHFSDLLLYVEKNLIVEGGDNERD